MIRATVFEYTPKALGGKRKFKKWLLEKENLKMIKSLYWSRVIQKNQSFEKKRQSVNTRMTVLCFNLQQLLL